MERAGQSKSWAFSIFLPDAPKLEEAFSWIFKAPVFSTLWSENCDYNLLEKIVWIVGQAFFFFPYVSWMEKKMFY